ncbi:MAG: TonB-dependent receptor domain-containing protein [Paludibacteraceae bacterium]
MKKTKFLTVSLFPKKKLLLLVVISSVSILYAQNGSIKGHVFDALDKEPLIGASVVVNGTTIGSATDFDGNYTLSNLKQGSYDLTISYVSYQSQTNANVSVEAGKETELNIPLESAEITLSEVQVIARANRESENILLLEQKKALLATQAVGAKEMSRKGISNAEGAVANVAGISKQEGVKNVFVRGLGDRYNATYLNGFPIPSEDPEYKNIALDFFGTDVIRSIGVNKVFDSSLAGDVGGAVIDIASKELVGTRSFSIDASIGANFDALQSDYLKQSGTDYFGFSDRRRPDGNVFSFKNSLDPHSVLPLNQGVGLSGGKSYTIGDKANPLSLYVVASHSKSYAVTDEIVRNSNTAGIIYQDQKGKKYTTNTGQLALINVLYGFNSHQLSYNFMMVHANDAYVGEYLGYNSERHQDSDTYEGFLRRQQANDNLLFTNQLSSDWKLNEKSRVTVGVSHNSVTGSEPDRRENYLSKKDAENYILTGSNRQKRFYSLLKENDFNAKLSLIYKLNDKRDNKLSNLRIGYNGRWIDDNFQSVEYNFSAVSGSYDINNLRLDDSYNQLGLDAGKFRMMEGEINKYRVTKFIHSPYAEVNYQLATRLLANAGVKFDRVDMTVDYHVQHVVPGENSINKWFALPSLNLKYTVNAKNVLRLGLSKTYTLPQSKEISPYQYVNITFASQGNPDLKQSENYNADVKWDVYLSPSELISLTGFYKHIVNPIARVDIGNSAGLLTYRNISDFACVVGAELEIRKNIFSYTHSTAEKANKLSVGLNASYIHTELTVPYTDFNGKRQSRKTQLEGAAPFILNFDISHQYSLRDVNLINTLVFNYFSSRIHTIGALGYQDIVEEGVPTLEFISSSKINKNCTVKLKALNILDPAFRLTRATTSGQDIILNEFKKGTSISLGLTYDL